MRASGVAAGTGVDDGAADSATAECKSCGAGGDLESTNDEVRVVSARCGLGETEGEVGRGEGAEAVKTAGKDVDRWCITGRVLAECRAASELEISASLASSSGFGDATDSALLRLAGGCDDAISTAASSPSASAMRF